MTELLLNLAWLLLAVPALWLWRGSRSAAIARKFTALQCLLALGCMLVVLFPVISATDDLRAMRTEMEESPASKRTIRQAANDKASGWKLQSPPALPATANCFRACDQGWQLLPTGELSLLAPPAIQRASRAPPYSALG
jgi:hypothetical protein